MESLKKKGVKEHRPAWGPVIEKSEVEPFMPEHPMTEIVGKFADWLAGATPRQTAYESAWEGYEDTAAPPRVQKQKSGLKLVRKPPQNTSQRESFKPRHNYGGTKNKGRPYQNRYRYGNFNSHGNTWFRKPSVVVAESWSLLEEIQLSQLSKVHMAEIPTAKDIAVLGTVHAYDRFVINKYLI